MRKDAFIDYDGKKIIVTGASSGLGKAIALELSNRGAYVILMGRNHEKLKDIDRQLPRRAHKIILMDLADPSRIMPGIKEISEELGRIYGFCNAASVLDTRPLRNWSADQFRSMLDVNLISGIEIARAVSRRDVIEEKGGSILFIASIYGLVGAPGQIGYSASKGAVLSAVRSMAAELARKRIRVNVISPGLTQTETTEKALSLLSKEQVKKIVDRHPLGIGNPEDIARVAAFVMAPQNRWMTGANIVVDGGYTAV